MSYDGSGIIPVGGGAVLLFDGVTPAGGYEICNIDEAADLWISDTTTAAAYGIGSFRIGAGGGTYVTPRNYRPLGPVSVFSNKASGHRITARAWDEVGGGGGSGGAGATGPMGPEGPPG